MRTNFSPSINIIRDTDHDFYYIPTPNSKEIYSQIATQFNTGLHSFNIVGSYGTGKSAFLLALQKHLKLEKEYFAPVNGQFNQCKKFDFLNIVGSFNSIITTFANELGCSNSSDDILTTLKERQKALKKTGTCLVIIIDELGKFLEYAVGHNPDKELYFIQQLAEFVNNKSVNILFISTLHQNFDAYSVGLTQSQRAEWEKVKGRLKELTFNEPIEQLLHLSTVFLKDQFSHRSIQYNADLTESIQESGLFSSTKSIDQNFAKALFPFDLLSISILAKALQQYGQNERSLFHFLSVQEKYSLFDYDTDENPYFNISCVYDYLNYNYYNTLISRYNPSYFKWSLLRNSLERVQLELPTQVKEAQKLIKTIGLLNILGSSVANIDDRLLLKYGEIALGIENPQVVLNQLLRKKIIRYQKYNDRYKLFEGTDIDIDQLIEDKKTLVAPVVDIVAALRGRFNLGIIPAKAITYQIGTPRFFEFQFSSLPIDLYQPKDRAVDGLINLIFNEAPVISKIKTIKNQAILHGIYQETKQLKNILQDIQATEAALKQVSADKVAKQELLERKEHYTNILNKAIKEDLFGKHSVIKWFFNGREVSISSNRVFNQQLSEICRVLYPDTPIFRNELMNKQKPSNVIHSAKKLYFQQLLNHAHELKLGFQRDKNPSEKTIYYTLLYHTGIHREAQDYAYFDIPTATSFESLWAASMTFLESAKHSRRSITEFIELLRLPPFGLKDGFIEFWIGTFLFIHKEKFALFGEAYIPKFSIELLELLFRQAHKYQIKTFQIEGIKAELFFQYSKLVQVHAEETAIHSSFKKIAAPFVVFYKQLPAYVQTTEQLDANTLAFRDALSKAKDLEKTFFEDLPQALGFNISASDFNVVAFKNKVEASINEMQDAMNQLINRLEEGLLSLLGLKSDTSFKTYSKALKKRYKPLKVHLLRPKQKMFYKRIMSNIDERSHWMDNIVQAIFGKRLHKLSDDDEKIMSNKLQQIFYELDNLMELGKVAVGENDKVLRVSILDNKDNAQSANIVITPKQEQEAEQLSYTIQQLLSENTKVNQAVLIKLLKKYL